MSKQIKEIGEMFRSRRQEMNLTLKEVENATSIRIHYLQGIEEGELSHFPSPVYIVGFIKQYAQFLGIDPEKLIAENPNAFLLKKQQQDFAYGIGTLEKREHNRSKGQSFSLLFWVIAGITLVISSWYFARYLGIF